MTPMVHKSNLLASLNCAPDYWRYTPTHYKDAFVDDWPDNPFTLDKVLEKLNKYKEITGNDAYNPSELLIKLAKNGEKFGEAPKKEHRKEKLDFEMSSVANNF